MARKTATEDDDSQPPPNQPIQKSGDSWGFLLVTDDSFADSTTLKFEIWDTAGQERYAALAPLCYRGAVVAVVVYDITSIDSFSKAQYWVKVMLLIYLDSEHVYV
ncbi:hypothetical protein QQ045_021388 [Rhodiola kirilowii]